MDYITGTVINFVWLLGQATFFGTYAFILFIAAGMILVGIMVWKIPESKAQTRRLLPLLTLPIIWIFVGLWGAFFRTEWKPPELAHPDWVFYPIYAALPLSGLLLIAFLLSFKGARIFTATFGFANIYFTAVMSLLAIMSASGNWI